MLPDAPTDRNPLLIPLNTGLHPAKHSYKRDSSVRTPAPRLPMQSGHIQSCRTAVCHKRYGTKQGVRFVSRIQHYWTNGKLRKQGRTAIRTDRDGKTPPLSRKQIDVRHARKFTTGRRLIQELERFGPMGHPRARIADCDLQLTGFASRNRNILCAQNAHGRTAEKHGRQLEAPRPSDRYKVTKMPEFQALPLPVRLCLKSITVQPTKHFRRWVCEGMVRKSSSSECGH